MSTLLDQPIDFGGGLGLPRHKAMSLELGLRQASLPQRLFLPLRQHHGTSAEPVVAVGERVLTGQCVARARGYISAAVHAASSGEVVDIREYPVPSPSGQTGRCMELACDGRDEWVADLAGTPDFHRLQPAEIQQRLLESGVVGMGGAGFPTAVKLIPALGQDIDLLIINAAECEPYISCDEAAIRCYAERLVTGIEILRHVVRPGSCVIGIEDSMMASSRERLEKAISSHAEGEILIRQVPSRYPAGGERQLIRSLTGIRVPEGGLPVDVKVLIHNVGTVIGIYNRIVLGQPSVSRVVSVTGDGVQAPANLEARLGTPAGELVRQCGGYSEDFRQLIVGGPMMGYVLQDDRAPIIKTSNCLLATGRPGFPPVTREQPCIACGECVTVCPESLLPHYLLRYARSADSFALQKYGLFSCIECGCCSYVCPSRIPLVDEYRRAKHGFWDRMQKRKQASEAKQRYLARQQRLQHDQQGAADSATTATGTLPDREQLRREIADAVARQKNRRSMH